MVGKRSYTSRVLKAGHRLTHWMIFQSSGVASTQDAGLAVLHTRLRQGLGSERYKGDLVLSHSPDPEPTSPMPWHQVSHLEIKVVKLDDL